VAFVWRAPFLYSLPSFFIVVFDFFLLCLPLSYFEKLKIIIYFIMIYFIIK
jgi:hypothetical protein